MKKVTKYLKVTLAMALLASIIFALATLLQQDKDQIASYYSDNDKQLILKSFDTDWYWLIPDGGTYEPSSLLPEYGGQDQIKIMHENSNPVGYVTYKMKNSIIGFIHFLHVKKEARGKGYAEKLVKHAVEDLKKQGARIITLMTRTDNKPAQKIYKNLGFKERPIDEKYVDFVKILV